MATYTGFDINGLIDQNYFNEHRDELVPKLVTEGITASLVDVIPNVKGSMTLNGIDNHITVQDGGCGWSPAGDVRLTQRELYVHPMRVNDTLCPADLYTTYLTEFMVNENELPFEQIIAETYLNQISAHNEDFIWGGNGTVDGLLQMIAEDDDVVDASSAVESAETAIAKLNALMAAAPTEVKTAKDGIVFCSFDFFDRYVNELRAANVYMLANTDYESSDYMIKIPGTNKRLVATAGIENFGESPATGELLVYTTAKNIALGCDFMTPESISNFRLWYSLDNQEYRFAANWKLGVNYRWSSFVVKGYTLA